jgi:hypothetical protein
MISMLSNSLIQQHNMNSLTWHITMKLVSADLSCSVVWWGASAACAEVSSGCVEASKAKHCPGLYVEPSTSGGNILVLLDFVLLCKIKLSCGSRMQQAAKDHEPDESGNS